MVKQEYLPGMVLPEARVIGKTRHPSRSYDHDISNQEILHHPLDLKFRYRLHQSINSMLETGDFTLEQVLPDVLLRHVKGYLYPDNRGNWLTQDEIAGGKRHQDFRKLVLLGYIRVWRRFNIGPRATEVLLLDLSLYNRLITYHTDKKDKTRHLRTIDGIKRCSPEVLNNLCPVPQEQDILEEAMRKYFPNWTFPRREPLNLHIGDSEYATVVINLGGKIVKRNKLSKKDVLPYGKKGKPQ